jgi:hypothetical protein
VANEPLLDRRFLERLERLTIHWQRSFNGLVGGHNRSRFSGGGQEFLDHRNYYPGDDLRAVNWRAFMRLDKMFLKMFQVEPRVPVRILLDISESMAVDPAKFYYARKLAASLAYVGLVRLDTVEVIPFSGELHRSRTVGGGRQRFTPLAVFLEELKSNGSTDFAKVARQFLNEFPQRGLVVVISDFLGEAEYEKSLQFLADAGNELCLIQLWTDDERSPSWSGEFDLVEAETGAKLHIHVDSDARRRYTEQFDKFAASLRTLALRNSGRYAGIPTSMSLDDAIFVELVRSRSVA